jgi:uncharacterized protein (TIGR02466 family)
MRKTRSWFPTLIYSEILENFLQHNRYLEEKAYKLYQDIKNIKTSWNCGTFNTLGNYNYKTDNDQIIQSLVNLSLDRIENFSKRYGIDESFSLRCDDLWINISKPGDFQEFHNHAGSHFSAVYYVNCRDKSGDIVFSPSHILTDMFPLPIKNYTQASFNSCYYTPKNAMLLLFRSNLTHMVKQNLSEYDRISISMNFTYFKKNEV